MDAAAKIKCDTVYDTLTLAEIPKEHIQATGSTCRACGRHPLILHHLDVEATHYIDVFVRCSIECGLYVRLRLKLP